MCVKEKMGIQRMERKVWISWLSNRWPEGRIWPPSLHLCGLGKA